jgi:hypothetical protein
MQDFLSMKIVENTNSGTVRQAARSGYQAGGAETLPAIEEGGREPK